MAILGSNHMIRLRFAPPPIKRGRAKVRSPSPLPLRDRIIAAITNHPNVRRTDLAEMFPDDSTHDISALVRDLSDEGVLVRNDRHQYRVVEQAQEVKRYESSGFIAPLNRAKLMARR